MSSNRAALGLLAAGLLAACVPPEPGTRGRIGPTMTVCVDGVCRDQPRDLVTAQLADGRELERQQDPDAWRGEAPAELARAAAEGDARAAHKLGQAHEFGAGGLRRSPGTAVRFYEQAADAGMPWAQWRLARLVEQGVAPGGRSRALQLNVSAARGGVARAAHNVGVTLAEGRGAPRNMAEAAQWFTLAAENGVAESQYNLALMLFSGDGVAREPNAAVNWMRTAARNGYLPAQRAAGFLYSTGLEEMGPDLQEARTWLAAAAAQGDAESRRLLPQVERALAAERAARLEFERALLFQRERTRALWGAVALHALLSPPPIVLVW